MWLLPTRANALTMLAQGTVPITMEAAFFSGDPRVESVSFGNAAVAHMNPFDADVSSTSGDIYLQVAIDPNAPYSPLTLAPGESGTITLTFTPSAKKGKPVSGFVDVDTFSYRVR